MSTPTISIPRSQKRWPISTIFTPENMHAIIVPHSCRHPFNSRFICGNSWRTIIPLSSMPSYHLRRPYHTTFVALFIPPSFCQNLSTTCQSVNSQISRFSQNSQFSQFSRLSLLSTLSTLSTNSRLSQLSPPSQKFHPSHPSKIFCPFVLLSFFSFCPSV